ncbi:MAG: hypothetical protein US89_C0009G0079, partial [Candidatus Peregrinibacteria bacterium GW2011_GWF2_38_29]
MSRACGNVHTPFALFRERSRLRACQKQCQIHHKKKNT